MTQTHSPVSLIPAPAVKHSEPSAEIDVVPVPQTLAQEHDAWLLQQYLREDYFGAMGERDRQRMEGRR